MNAISSSLKTRLRVGIFTFTGFLMILAIIVIVNNRPNWWRPCQLVKISVEDATGLKSASPVRSLGINIGYLKSVSLSETSVTLGICITEKVQVLPSTRAYIRGEGFMGDKFVELKPVRYVGGGPDPMVSPKSDGVTGKIHRKAQVFAALSSFLISEAWAEPADAAPAQNTVTPAKATSDVAPKPTYSKRPLVRKGGTSNKVPGEEIPVGDNDQDIQHMMTRVDELVKQVGDLTDNLKEAVNPEDFKKTMHQLNHTLENASRTLAPEGGLNQTAQRSLAKLEDAIEQFRDLMTRVNRGDGSVGMLLNDPSYADEIRMAIQNINKLLNKVSQIRFNVEIGGVYLAGYNGGRGWFQLGIWPRPDRYYLLGIAGDTRGKVSTSTITTTAGGLTQTTQTQIVDQSSLVFTAMFGKVFYNRLDLSIGALYGDGAGSVNLWLGPRGLEDRIQLRNDLYVRYTAAGSVDDRVSLSIRPWHTLYVRAGVDSFRTVNGQLPFFVGAGISFDDEDIKLLFSLR